MASAPPTIESLRRSLDYARRQKAFAWAKYYEQVNSDLMADTGYFTTVNRVVSEDAIPTHIKTELAEMAAALKKKWECPICIEMIESGTLEITNCGHYYCKPCLAALKETCRTRGDRKWECAVCRRKHGFGADSE